MNLDYKTLPFSLPKRDLDEVRQRGHEIWARLKGTHLLLTGCTGFFGKWLFETLQFANAELDLQIKVDLVTRSVSSVRNHWKLPFSVPGVEWIEADIKSVRLPPHRYSHVVHAASPVSVGEPWSKSSETFRSIVEGTENILEQCSKISKIRVLYVSSGAVYGPQFGKAHRISENVPALPGSTGLAYSEGKLAAEAICRRYVEEHAMEIVIARCFAFVGPFLPLDSGYAIGNFIGACIRSENSIQIKGDGTPLRSYLYGTDLALWLWTLLINGISGDVYNVGSEEGISIEELAQLCSRRLTKSRLAIQRISNPVEGCLPASYVPDTSRVKTRHGLTSHVSLENAIKRTALFYSKTSE